MKFLQAFFDVFIDMTPFLLIGLTAAGILHVLVKKDFVARHIGSNSFGSIVKASLLGVPLPLCSCGVIPTGTYLKRSGASRGAVMSFLISTPQTGVDSIAATYAMLGPFFAVFRPVAAFFMGIFGGLSSHLLGKESKEKETPRFTADTIRLSSRQKIRKMAGYAYGELLDDISVQLIFGIILAALITFLLPDNFLQDSPWSSGLPAMLLMVAIGVPLYVCSTSSIPIAAALIAKGLSPGAAYVFLIAGPATNAAALTVLSRVLGKKQTVLFVISVVIGSLGFGALMDLLTTRWNISIINSMGNHAHGPEIWEYLLAGIFGVLLLRSLFLKIVHRRKAGNHTHEPDIEIQGETMSEQLNIEGMTCHHCQATVQSALENVEGVTGVVVDLDAKRAVVKGNANRKVLVKAVTDSGYTVV